MDIPPNGDGSVAPAMTADGDGSLPHTSHRGAFSARLTPR